MKTKNTIRITIGGFLVVLGFMFALFWQTAIKQQSGLISTRIQTQEDIDRELPVLSRALDILDVDLFAPSEDAEVMMIWSQMSRRLLLGLCVCSAGIGILLLTRSANAFSRISIILGRIIAFSFSGICFLLIFWSIHRGHPVPPLFLNQITNSNKSIQSTPEGAPE